MGTNHYWLKKKELYECEFCHLRMILRSGSLLGNSKLSYQYWFICIHITTATKKTISALEMQRQLGHLYCELIWSIMHKMRRVMGQPYELYQLDGQV
jgi:hypothetical protein